MRWRRVLRDSVALLLIPLSPLASANDQPSLPAWSPCAIATRVASTRTTINTSIPLAECATVTMPLCHGDVCSDTMNRAVELFIKRIPSVSNTSTRNVWFFPDHALAMSVQDVETQMLLLHQQLIGDVSVYVMDQRGTGRSTLFDCDATSKDSPLGIAVAPSEVADCALALRTKFGDQFAQAFSLTSAARDVVTFISTFQAHTKVFLYGVGVGTLLVERTMHFPSDEIIGFVMDSTATSSGGKKKEFPYRSRSDKDFGVVAKAFLAVCDDDASCAGRFDGKKLDVVVQDLLKSLDQPTRSCEAVATSLQDFHTQANAAEPASYGLRRVLATMIQESALRPFLPVIVYRLRRCHPSDVDVLTHFLSQLQSRLDLQLKRLAETSSAGAAMLVLDMIQFSEMWESPPPSQSELLARFTKTLASPGVAYRELERYCAFTLDKTSACRGGVKTNSTVSLSYDRDANWNKPSVIKEQASVLLLGSRYDGVAPLIYAQTLMDSLVGDSKQLLAFDAAAHNVLVTTPLIPTAAESEDRSLDVAPSPASCARSVLVSFGDNDGDLTRLDTSCVTQLPATANLTISETLSVDVLGVTDAYDGVLPVASSDSSSSTSRSGGSGVETPREIPVPLPTSGTDTATTTTQSLEKSRNRYRIAFIVLLVVVIVLVAVVVVLLYRARQRKRLEEEELQLRKMRGETEDDMEFLRDLYNPSPSEWFNYRSNRVHL